MLLKIQIMIRHHNHYICYRLPHDQFVVTFIIVYTVIENIKEGYHPMIDILEDSLC